MLYTIIVGGDSGRLANSTDLLLGLGGCINYDNGWCCCRHELDFRVAADNTRRPVLLKSLTLLQSVKYEAFSVGKKGDKRFC